MTKRILIIITIISAVACGQRAPATSGTTAAETTAPETAAVNADVPTVEEFDDMIDGERHPIDIQMDKDMEADDSTAGTIEAYEKASEAWEREIRKNYDALLNLLNNDDCRKKLRTAQEAWLAFQKDEMAFNSDYWNLFSGTMFAPATLYYRMYLARKRAFELWYYFNKATYVCDTYFDQNTDVRSETGWDQLLNENYKRLMGKLNKTQQNQLRAAQRRWIAYRDAEDECYNTCNLMVDNPEYVLLIIRERALRLDKYANDIDELK